MENLAPVVSIIPFWFARVILFSCVAISVFFSVNNDASAIDGRLFGRITVADPRAIVGTSGRAAVVPRVVVSVRAIPRQSPPDGSGCCTVVNPRFYAVTDANGAFDCAWSDNSRTEGQIPLEVVVHWYSSNASGGELPPSRLFTIQSYPGNAVETRFNTVMNIVSSAWMLEYREYLESRGHPPFDAGWFSVLPRVFAVPAGDVAAAYLTTDEMFRRVVNASATLRDRMPGLVVVTGAPPSITVPLPTGDVTIPLPTGGVTPFPDRINLTAGVPVSAPNVVAHEIGHAISWRAFDLPVSAISPAPDYGFDLTWGLNSRESSKAAFLEGMAEHSSLVWLFGPNAAARLVDGVFPPGTVATLDYTAGTLVPINAGAPTAVTCNTVAAPWDFPFCHAAALREVIDNDGNDGADLTVANIVDIMNSYPKHCITDGCRDEISLDISNLNHNDFLNNAGRVVSATRVAAMRAAFARHGLAAPGGGRVGP